MDDPIEIIEQWLDTKPYTLWATWDLSQPERKRLAAEWFAKEIVDFNSWMGGTLG